MLLNKYLRFVMLVLMFSLLTAVHSSASFYEVEGIVLSNGNPVKNVDIYLLRNQYEVVKIHSTDGKDIIEITDQRFGKAYEELKSEIVQLNNSVDTKQKRYAGKIIKKKFLKLIRKHLVRKVSRRNGQFYLNVSPDVKYHIVVVKKRGLTGWNKPFVYWIGEVYFAPGVLETPQKIVFDNTNVKKL